MARVVLCSVFQYVSAAIYDQDMFLSSNDFISQPFLGQRKASSPVSFPFFFFLKEKPGACRETWVAGIITDFGGCWLINQERHCECLAWIFCSLFILCAGYVYVCVCVRASAHHFGALPPAQDSDAGCNQTGAIFVPGSLCTQILSFLHLQMPLALCSVLMKCPCTWVFRSLLTGVPRTGI